MKFGARDWVLILVGALGFISACETSVQIYKHPHAVSAASPPTVYLVAGKSADGRYTPVELYEYSRHLWRGGAQAQYPVARSLEELKAYDLRIPPDRREAVEAELNRVQPYGKLRLELSGDSAGMCQRVTLSQGTDDRHIFTYMVKRDGSLDALLYGEEGPRTFGRSMIAGVGGAVGALVLLFVAYLLVPSAGSKGGGGGG